MGMFCRCKGDASKDRCGFFSSDVSLRCIYWIELIKCSDRIVRYHDG